MPIDRDLYPQFRHAVARFAKLADARSAVTREAAIIQVGVLSEPFLVYISAADLDADAADFIGMPHVRETVRAAAQRRPFADIDTHENDLNSLTIMFAAAFDSDPLRVLVMPTGRGVHLVATDVWCTVEAQRAALEQLSGEGFLGVDEGAVHSLRLATTVSEKKGRPDSHKALPAGFSLSQTLVQPWGAPAAAVTAVEPQPQLGDLSQDIITAASEALSGVPDTFEFSHWSSNAAVLSRVRPCHCTVCERVHEHDGAYVYLHENGSALAVCQRGNRKNGVVFKVAAPRRDPTYPGLFEARTATLYNDPKGCVAPIGNYVDGSPCGLGKSKAAWASIGKKQTVVCISFRKAFSAKVAADEGLELYSNITGEIDLSQHRRLVIQVDSLERLRGVPDVLVVDEYHGIRRQLYGECANARHRKAASALHDLIQKTGQSGRVIVLDADANDRDLDILERLLPGRPPLYINQHKAHESKTLHMHGSAVALEARLLQWAEQYMAKPEGERNAGRCAIFAHAKTGKYSVEYFAKLLIGLGLRIRWYHARTDGVERAKDFSDVEAAFRDIDCIVYNATIEAGVSIEMPQFSQMFLFSSCLGDVETLKQAMFRCRCVTEYEYAETPSSGRPWAGPTTADGLASWVTAKRKGVLPKEQAAVVRDVTIDHDEDLNSAHGLSWVTTTLERNRSQAYFTPRLVASLQKTGFNIVRHEGSADRPDLKPIPGIVLPESLTKPWEAVVGDAPTAGRPGVPTYEELETGCFNSSIGGSSAPRTVAEIAGDEKIYLARVYRVDLDRVDAKFVKDFGEGAVHKFQRWERLKRAAPAILGDSTTSEVEQVRRIDEALTAIGAGTMLAPAAIPGHDLKAALAKPAAVEILTEMGKEWSRLFPGVRLRAKEPLKILRHALDHYGCEFVSSNRKDPNRGVYKVRETSWPEPECALLARGGN